jgi:hypothetical protein
MPCTFSIVLVYIVVRRYDSKLYQIQKSLGEKISPKTVSDTEVFGGEDMTQNCIRYRSLWGRRYDPKLYQIQKSLGALEGIWRLRKVLSCQVFYRVVSWILI